MHRARNSPDRRAPEPCEGAPTRNKKGRFIAEQGRFTAERGRFTAEQDRFIAEHDRFTAP